MLKKVLLLAAVVGSTLPAVAAAEEASPLSFNVGAVSDYRYRGISQTRLKPALQAGVDYALPGGFYVGAWASTIKWIKDANGGANVEVDLYGGYKGEIAKDLTFDVGVLRYQYPSHDLPVAPNTTEVYGALTYGPATLKYSHSVTNLFGFDDSKGSGYLEAGASFDVYEGIMLAPHVGYQKVKNYSVATYYDYSLTVSKDISGFVLSAGVVGAKAKESGVKFLSPVDNKDIGKAGLVLGVKKTF